MSTEKRSIEVFNYAADEARLSARRIPCTLVRIYASVACTLWTDGQSKTLSQTLYFVG